LVVGKVSCEVSIWLGDVVGGKLDEIGDFVYRVLVFDEVVIEDFDAFFPELASNGHHGFDGVEDSTEDGNVAV